MKFIATFLKSLLSLGSLGLIMALMAGLILFASFAQISEPFYTTQERMQLLDTLEDEISVALNQMQRSEAFTAFALEYFEAVDLEAAQAARAADAEISALLEDLRANDHFEPQQAYAGDIAAELVTFDKLRAAHRQTFEQMINAYQAGNIAKGQALLEQLQDENQGLNGSLRLVVRYVERGRLDAMGAFPDPANRAILMAAASLTVLLLLTLVGYLRVAAATRPLHRLSNAITAIGGDQYRPELLGNLLRQAGPPGRLARALNQLALEQQAQNAGLKIEAERLRQELYESRRRRLKLYHEVDGGGENQ